ncbi:leucyl aminopeptidase family protein [Aureimonas jatrophae]|uniref:Leucyl aminopeptidase n=1 Tax=Aureimonas jatrophae TaxID=1166073 RepID=A0A1H0LUC9_9HYPH|nr:leucyl aminopeptidase family protein [Aureimonas jatrophae]MBB3952753.1 leucyl aminopeptidase [Aureimonas jatrophae]SDO71808.1 leucyl aminopeptidase [Aureimonas jatrophae]
MTIAERLLSDPSDTRPVYPVFEGGLEALPESARVWAEANGFKASPGALLVLPGEDGRPGGAVLGLGQGSAGPETAMLAGALAQLPAGAWRLDTVGLDAELAALAFLLGGYRFERYVKPADPDRAPRLHVTALASREAVLQAAEAIVRVRDLVNTPTNDLGPDGIEAAARDLAERHGAGIEVTAGDALLPGFPLIHAVGRASAVAPRLIDIRWGEPGAPRVTLVGKGVAFDTGGLDIKPASGMLLMKKDMGGAANVLGLASMVMAAGLPVRLRVLVPAVENAISANSFRPGDILRSRQGDTVEIGNTDAEGRLILADALSLAGEEEPEILVDMATLTGAARVALGPELPPFYTDDEALADEIAAASAAVHDPLWRLPLWRPYAKALASKIADTNNVTADGFAGSVTAALFLQRFAGGAKAWVHFDVYGWRPQAGPLGPAGGEAQGIRALFRVLAARYPAPRG